MKFKNGASSVICKFIGEKSSVEHYSNEAYIANHIDYNDPRIGLKNTKIVQGVTGNLFGEKSCFILIEIINIFLNQIKELHAFLPGKTRKVIALILI
jgi:hypothetical protein